MFKKIPFLYLVMGSSQSRESAVEIINRWNSEPRERLIFDYGREEVSQYLQAVAKVQQTSSSDESELKQILPMAVTRLKHEFQTVLARQAELVMGSNSTTELSTVTDSTSYQFFVVYEAPSAEVIQYLRRIAEMMSSCGHLEACIQVYRSVRKPFVETIFRRLRLDELKAGDTRRFLSEELKMKIERWIEAAKVCIKKLFEKEKQFATQIFSGLGRNSSHEECFLYVAKDAALSLFSFAESVSSSHQSSQRLNVILILYDAMLSFTKDVNALFALDSGNGIRNSLAATSSKLGDEVRRMLSVFEDDVLNEISTVSNNDGGRVHQLTRHVIGYINVIMNHRESLMSLIVSRPSKIAQDMKLPDDLFQDPKSLSSLSPLALHLVLIIAVLLLNLENKSKYYRDASLGDLFMMNNVNYVVLKIKEFRDLQEMIGVDCLNKLDGDVKRAMTSYQNSTCDSLLNCLGEERLYVSRCFSSRVSTSALRRSITKFDDAFEKIKSLQSSWEVHDLSLREELRHSMLEKLKPAYERFLEKFKNHLESGQESTKCFQHGQKIGVKYTVQDLKSLVEKSLFSRHQLPSSSEEAVDNFHSGGG